MVPHQHNPQPDERLKSMPKYKSLLLLSGLTLLVWSVSLRAEVACKGPGLSLSVVSHYVLLEGSLCPGDGNKFIQFMSTTGKNLSLVRLNMRGGLGLEAVKIGQYLRRHSITTWTDGRQDLCASACNRVFAGGVQRIYSHANYINTDKNRNQHLGLGYHHPNEHGDFQAASPFYHQYILPYLKEMLPPKAYDWVLRTDEGNLTSEMVWLNGQQALDLGIATSNKPPQ